MQAVARIYLRCLGWGPVAGSRPRVPLVGPACRSLRPFRAGGDVGVRSRPVGCGDAGPAGGACGALPRRRPSASRPWVPAAHLPPRLPFSDGTTRPASMRSTCREPMDRWQKSGHLSPRCSNRTPVVCQRSRIPSGGPRLARIGAVAALVSLSALCPEPRRPTPTSSVASRVGGAALPLLLATVLVALVLVASHLGHLQVCQKESGPGGGTPRRVAGASVCGTVRRARAGDGTSLRLSDRSPDAVHVRLRPLSRTVSVCSRSASHRGGRSARLS